MTDGRIEKGKASRERIVEAGREAFGDRGFDNTSVTDIIEEAGIAKGSFYHHFDSKAALFDAVLDRVVQEAAETAAERARRAGDPAESLKDGCGAWLEMALDPQIQRIAFVDAAAVVGWTRMREIDDHHTLGGMRHNLEAIAAQGDGPDADIDLLAHMILAAVNEAALFIVGADDPREALEVGRRDVNLLIDRLTS